MSKSVRSHAKAWLIFLVKGAVGLVITTVGFQEIAPRYDQWKASGFAFPSLASMPLEGLFWSVISLALLAVGILILAVTLWQSRHGIRTKSSLEKEKRTESDVSTEFDVAWRLSGDVQAKPWFGSEDMPSSDKASTLSVKQQGSALTLAGKMGKLKPTWLYDVYLSKPMRPFSIYPPSDFHPIGSEEAPYLSFQTDESGSGSWSIPISINDLQRYGIIDRFMVIVNDSPKNKTVLLSDHIPIKVDFND